MNVSFRYRFESAHRFLNAESPSCQTPHGHTWYATLKWRSAADALDACNMLGEFQKLKDGWKKFITETADHSFFHHQNDPIVPVLRREIPGFRGLPFPGDPTTEIIAVLFLRKAQTLAQDRGIKNVIPFAVEIRETPVNAVEVTVEDAIFRHTVANLPERGWWSVADTAARSFD